MDDEKLREPDEVVNERICDPVIEIFELSKDEKKKVIEKVEEDVLNSIPFEDDNLDELIVKQTYLEEKVLPILYNFHLKNESFENVYLDIQKKIELFRNMMFEGNCNKETVLEDKIITVPMKENPVSTEVNLPSSEDVRLLRIAYYEKMKKI